MARACCARPVAKIIKIADFESGLTGLDQALQNVYISGVSDDVQIQNELLQWIKDFGNYITPSREEAYREALLREYKLCVKRMEQAIHERETERHRRSENDMVLPTRKRWFQFRKGRSL